VTLDLVRGFADPLEPFEEELAMSWLSSAYELRLALFRERFGAAVDARSRGVTRMLDRLPEIASGAERFDLIWHPFCNLVTLNGATEAAIARAAQLALRLGEADDAASFEVRFGEPTALGFGAYSLPEATRVELAAAPGRRRITAETATGPVHIHFVRSGGRWETGEPAAMRNPSVHGGDREVFLLPLPRPHVGRDDEEVVAATPAMVATLQAALDLIAAASPAYARWISRLLHVVVPLRLVEGQFNSETYAAINGAIFVSIHDDVVRTAETLVHEVTHDYLHGLLTIDPLVDPGASETFYSPPRRTDRPTIGILKAEHAFGNALIFYYLLEIAGHEVSGCHARGREELEEWRVHFESCLARSEALTDAGAEVWRALAGRIDQFQALHGIVTAPAAAPHTAQPTGRTR
jgi:HEXXH motif-containing protein